MTVAISAERAPALVKALVTADAQVYQVTPQRTSLEHLFLELTGDDRANHDTYTAAGSQAMPAVVGAERK